jgi:glyoxylase-like metal-dependent hydrolase (beta-lactamase superfamily II)
MKIHHLNCGSMCPIGQRMINGEGQWLAPAHLCCHCLLIESRQGLILVDTGLGTADVARPERLGSLFRHLVRPVLKMEDTAWHQIQELGLDPRDVRHIVPTHLDLDHAGGLGDFPQAEVHVYAKELNAAMHPGFTERARYVPDQWAHGPRWSVKELRGERWLGLEAVRAVPGTDDEVLLVPLIGHTRGHCGVAVHTDDGWLLHAGDAYFHHLDLIDPARAPWGLRVFQHLVQVDASLRLANQQRLHELKSEHPDDLQIFCAHDPVELSQMRAAERIRNAASASAHRFRASSGTA